MMLWLLLPLPGIDVVYDPVGGSASLEALKTVNWGAQFLVIGFAGGIIPKIPANLLLVKNTTLHGIFWGSYMQGAPAVLRESMAQVLSWVAGGQIQLHISHRWVAGGTCVWVGVVVGVVLLPLLGGLLGG